MPELVNENEWGAYLGMKPEFLKEFHRVESNKNFEVFDKNRVRLILAKCSRLADEGIDFNRKLPSFAQAQDFAKFLPESLDKLRYSRNLAFAANSKAEYEKKLQIYENFYSFLFPKRSSKADPPQIIYVAPHCGQIKRKPDKVLPFPYLQLDSFSARLAAHCALKDRIHPERKPSKREIIFIHSTGFFGGVIILGDLGIAKEKKLKSISQKLAEKYYSRIQEVAPEYKKNAFLRTMTVLRKIEEIKGTLNPEELKGSEDEFYLTKVKEWLGKYGEEIESDQLSEFEEKISKVLNQIGISPILVNWPFSGRYTAKLLRLPEKIKAGLLDWALQIEGQRFYLEKEPELVAEMVLEIRERYNE